MVHRLSPETMTSCYGNLKCVPFNGKEKDYESGFHYYGARYYWGELLTGWLSVDPMMDKYPGMSPYAYCAWNPVKLVDPDGRDVYIYGDENSKTKALQQIQQKSKNMKFSINEQGLLTYEGKAKTKQEKYMRKIIENPNIHVNLQVQENSNYNGVTIDIGGFAGNTLSPDKISVNAYQVINVIQSADMDKKCNNPGNMIWHEIAEAYEGGLISSGKGVNAPAAIGGNDKTIYKEAHYNAGAFFPGSIVKSDEPLLPQRLLTPVYGPITNTSPVLQEIIELANMKKSTYTYQR